MKSSKRPSDAAAVARAHQANAESRVGSAAPDLVPGSKQASPSEVAAYIADMGASLAALARTSDLKVLAYLHNVASVEATDQARAKSAKA